MTQENIISRVHKLLRLSTSSNANEAALAASRAQELIDQHNLDAALLALDGVEPVQDEPILSFTDAPLEGSQKTQQTWRQRVAMMLCQLNGCRVWCSGPNLMLVGRPSDAETVRYMYSYLTREVERLTQEQGRGNGATWRNNFRLGVTDTIRRKLNEQHYQFTQTARAGATTTSALMRVDTALATINKRGAAVDAWLKGNMKLRKRVTSSHAQSHSSARAAGQRAGQSIQVGGGRGLSSGAKRIGQGV